MPKKLLVKVILFFIWFVESTSEAHANYTTYLYSKARTSKDIDLVCQQVSEYYQQQISIPSSNVKTFRIACTKTRSSLFSVSISIQRSSDSNWIHQEISFPYQFLNWTEWSKYKPVYLMWLGPDAIDTLEVLSSKVLSF